MIQKHSVTVTVTSNQSEKTQDTKELQQVFTVATYSKNDRIFEVSPNLEGQINTHRCDFFRLPTADYEENNFFEQLIGHKRLCQNYFVGEMLTSLYCTLRKGDSQ